MKYIVETKTANGWIPYATYRTSLIADKAVEYLNEQRGKFLVHNFMLMPSAVKVAPGFNFSGCVSETIPSTEFRMAASK